MWILAANEKDLARAEEKGMKAGLIDRLRLTEERIKGMAEGIEKVTQLPDPVGELLETIHRPNGLVIEKRRVPLGVVGIIYESRPNVTADAFSLCFKSGNAVILKGGSDALYSNKAIVSMIREGLEKSGVTEDAISFIDATDRADHGIYENEGICGCPDSERWSRTDPQCGGKQYHTGYRNRYRELSYLY